MAEDATYSAYSWGLESEEDEQDDEDSRGMGRNGRPDGCVALVVRVVREAEEPAALSTVLPARLVQNKSEENAGKWFLSGNQMICAT